MVRTFGCRIVALYLFALSGCGSDLYQTAKVTGTVTCEEKPAFGGFIRFRPIDAHDETGRPSGQPGRESFATVGEDGTFTLKMDTAANATQDRGALIGPHDVIFKLPRTEPVPIHPEDRERATAEDLARLRVELDKKFPVGAELPCSANIIPNRVDVEPGGNNFDFVLSPK